MINAKVIMWKKVITVFITILLQGKIYMDIKAVEVVKEITDQAAIIKKGNGTINLYKITDESGIINYQLTVAPTAGYKLENINIDGEKVTEIQEEGGSYKLEGYKEVKAQKVHFGRNEETNQLWWMVWYQESGYGESGGEGALVLICDPDQPIANNKKFLLSNQYEYKDLSGRDEWQYYNKEAYKPGWECDYADFIPVEGETLVYANHYGGSGIRKGLNSYLKNSIGDMKSKFSEAEQRIMKKANIWTYDAKTGKNYKIKDKLSLGAGDYTNKYITVGANRVDSSKSNNAGVDNGLRVGLVASNGPQGSPYIITGNKSFRLRSPYEEYSLSALEAYPGYYVGISPVIRSTVVVPTLALDPEYIISASVLENVQSTGSQLKRNLDAQKDVVYFRVTGGTKINSTAIIIGDKINITKGSESDSIYLCIQGAEDDGDGDWCYTKEITGDCEVKVSEIGIEDVTDFNNCCIWLEMKDNNTNLIYAKKVATSAVPKLNSYIGYK